MRDTQYIKDLLARAKHELARLKRGQLKSHDKLQKFPELIQRKKGQIEDLEEELREMI